MSDTVSWKLTALIVLCCFAPQGAGADEVFRLAKIFFAPLPAQMPGGERDTAAQVALGQALYFETALSANHSQSCNSCHELRGDASGADPRPTSPGALGKQGRRNSPTVWNAGLQFRQFWDGRAESLQAQAASPLLSVDEMALESEAQAVQRLLEAGYSRRFAAAYPESEAPVSFANLTHSLAAFQRTLISEDRLDVYLRGDQQALNGQEKRGLKRFVEIGCNGCHNGALLGGQEFMKLGIAHLYPNKDDEGRAEVTGNTAHRFYFKVPPLRNVGLTAPYFHDGAGQTLERAVFDTAWHQLGFKLSEADVNDISAFLRSMNNRKRLTNLPLR